mmetsp:Transcript_101540/g.295947  ORF Transcript_101540/g.295947 Transcript_101540/m.295947 type:complete len:227 (+) Transcript_101540:130-810(+)
MSMRPWSQLVFPCCSTCETRNTLSIWQAVSKLRKLSVMSSSNAHPHSTAHGTTNNAICVEEPTATPSARSILPFNALVTAVACSAALPTMGSRIVPMKALGKPKCSDTSSMESTKHSEQAATTRVEPASISIAVPIESSGSGSSFSPHAPSSVSSAAPSCSSWKRSACVFSWKTRKAKYTKARNMEQTRESSKTSRSVVPIIILNIVGRQMLIEATTWQVMFAAAP